MSHPLDLGRSKRELLRFSLPTIFTMLILSSYVVVDGIFVARVLGSLALSSLNMVYPVYGAIGAVGLMLAVGGSAFVAKIMGQADAMRARSSFSMLVIVQIAIGLIFALATWLGAEYILDAVNCSEIQRELCRAYMLPLMAFAPAHMLQMTYQMFFVTSGRPGLGLILIISAGLCNVALDYYFLVELKMGIEGAAYATSLGACVPALGGTLYFWLSKKSVLQFARPRLKWRELARISYNGSSEMATSLSMAVTTFLFNLGFMKYYGEEGVAALAIVLYLQFLFVSVNIGFADGVAPISSYQFGRRNTGMLRRILRSSLICTGGIALASYAGALIFLDDILAIFAERGSHVYQLAHEGFYAFSLGFLLMGFTIYVSAFFTSLGNGLYSALVAMARTLVFLGASIVLLPMAFGAMGLWLAIPIAELLGLIFAFICLRHKQTDYGY